MSTCKQWREGDENVCTCGFRWDINEDDPHRYAEEAKAQALVEEEHQGDRDVARYEKGRETINRLKKELNQ